MKELKTTIKITKESRDYLKSVGRKDETYEDIIMRLIRNGNEK